MKNLFVLTMMVFASWSFATSIDGKESNQSFDRQAMSPNPAPGAVDLEILVKSGPNSADMQIVLHNPFDEPLMLEDLVMEFPRSEGGSLLGESLMVDIRRFSRIESEVFDDIEVFWLKFREGIGTVGPAQEATLPLGVFSGLSPEQSTRGMLRVTTSAGVGEPIPFHLEATRPELAEDGKGVVVTTDLRRFNRDSIVGAAPEAAMEPCFRESFTVGVTSVTCKYPICIRPFQCKEDDADTDSITIPSMTLNVPECNCL